MASIYSFVLGVLQAKVQSSGTWFCQGVPACRITTLEQNHGHETTAPRQYILALFASIQRHENRYFTVWFGWESSKYQILEEVAKKVPDTTPFLLKAFVYFTQEWDTVNNFVPSCFWYFIFVVFSACGGIRTGRTMPVWTAYFPVTSWERVDCSWHHH